MGLFVHLLYKLFPAFVSHGFRHCHAPLGDQGQVLSLSGLMWSESKLSLNFGPFSQATYLPTILTLKCDIFNQEKINFVQNLSPLWNLQRANKSVTVSSVCSDVGRRVDHTYLIDQQFGPFHSISVGCYVLSLFLIIFGWNRSELTIRFTRDTTHPFIHNLSQF